MSDSMQADELLDKGIELYNEGDWSKALECWERAKILYEKSGDKQGISIILNNIGNIYDNRGEWERALKYYDRCLKLKEELGDKQGISNTLNNIALIHNYRGEWKGNVLLRTALANSMNVPSIKIMDGIGFDPAIERAAALYGMTEPTEISKTFPRVFPLALGVIAIAPIQSARASATP